MTAVGWIQIVLFCVLLVAITKPLGAHMAAVFENRPTFLDAVFSPIERMCYKLCGVDPAVDMHWTEYTFCLLTISCASTLFTYTILQLQGFLPGNPMGFSTTSAPSFATAVTPDLAFNTAVSFATNTNWQAYAGEGTFSYLAQMLGLAMHNWLSAASGIVVAVALIRGFVRRSSNGVGNFWQDLIRAHLYVLFPLTFVVALLLVSQGVIQNFSAYVVATGLEGAKQTIAMGPVASQEAIKMLGTNGGGFFNANSAHPFENPTPFSNFIEMLSIFIIPASLTYTFGRMVKDTRQGWILLTTMFIFFLSGLGICYNAEASGNPNFAAFNINGSTLSLGDSGGNMEGKEVRFGLANSALFATVTTDASCGGVNCSHDSLTPLGGLIPLLNIQLGEIIFGGVGSGLYGMLVFAVLTVFIAGLMVGRTPEYLGKKIEKKEVKMAMLYVLTSAASILIFSAMASVLNCPVNTYWNAPGATFANVNNNGAHGFSEILYAFSSATGNNGSAFAGLSANTPFYNLTTGIAMLLGRFLMIVPIMAMAGSLASKKYVPPTTGTFPTNSLIFVVLLSSVILIVGALTYFPALTLGPAVDHFLMWQKSLS
ncbi:MAG: potassium-transporting ATPase subunit KdpA [Candidatus Obscuribacterales bacterium]|nr:potassium-transporting ATPase subunit KdpA [Candidatus Obscuribacterales bacterium]